MKTLKVEVQVKVEVYPTEDKEKVKQAVENIFGAFELAKKAHREGCLLTAKKENSESLSKFVNLLHRERIQDAARSILFKGLKGNTITFYLNKQVAYAGHISFCEPIAESPLGPIEVQISCDDSIELINWLAPRTNYGNI
ncbi:MAG: hypothetical protein JSV51_07065 [Candidatus Bathyarchaeota archaeon]|nr:MAG: hypothetical protein JSV51_07065 [Candidatus Bathyarchaeota archaeon]